MKYTFMRLIVCDATVTVKAIVRAFEFMHNAQKTLLEHANRRRYWIYQIIFKLLLAGILLPATLPVFAQWSENPSINNVISTYINVQQTPAIVSDGAGGAIITWQDDRNDDDDIYAQRINSAGIKMWTANGIPVCTATGTQFHPTIISNGEGGAIITWIDFRAANPDVYTQKINANGTTSWTLNGVGICTQAGSQSEAVIITDGLKGAIITWADYRNGVKGDIYAQRVNAAGTTEWPVNGVPVCTAIRDQNEQKIVSDGSGGAIITWNDLRSGTELDIYAQRVNATGEMQWTTDGVAICTHDFAQFLTTIIADGAAGAIISWKDNRNNGEDIYAQRINAAGASMWTPDGNAICIEAHRQLNPQMATDGSQGVIITWEDYRNAGIPDIYAQRVNASGVALWAPGGNAVCTAVNRQAEVAIIAVTNGAAIITWNDKRDNTTYDIYAQKINADGATEWLSDGVTISTATGDQTIPVITPDANGGAIIAWNDQRSDEGDIYAQNVKADGTKGCNSPVVSAQPLPTQTLCKNSAPIDLSVTAAGDGLTYQWYSDNNKMDFDGNLLTAGTNTSFTPQAGTEGTDYYYVIVTGTCGSDTSDYATVTINPLFTWYQDADQDGYGNGSATQTTCTKPIGYVEDNTDCNDGDAAVHSAQTWYRDYDKDGYGDAGYPKSTCSSVPASGYVKNHSDCNDHDMKIHTSQTYYKDYDKDGYGDNEKTVCVCSSTPPRGYVKNHSDCNDHDKKIHSTQTYFKDYDKDGYGDPDKSVCICSSTCPPGYVKDNTDCNDKDKNIHSAQTYYKDYDKDGYGDPSTSICVCSSICPAGYVKDRKDCNDRNKNIHPGAKEIAGNKIDDNCNGKVDERTTLARGENDESISEVRKDLLNASTLKVNVLPNPSPDYFTLNIKGRSDKPVQLRIVDIAGRLLEVKTNVAVNSSLTIGQNYKPGVYLVEVMQGEETLVIRCIKQ